MVKHTQKIRRLYINTKVEKGNKVLTIWQWAHSRNCHLTAAFIPAKRNIVADRESGTCQKNGEWVLLSKDL